MIPAHMLIQVSGPRVALIAREAIYAHQKAWEQFVEPDFTCRLSPGLLLCAYNAFRAATIQLPALKAAFCAAQAKLIPTTKVAAHLHASPV